MPRGLEAASAASTTPLRAATYLLSVEGKFGGVFPSSPRRDGREADGGVWRGAPGWRGLKFIHRCINHSVACDKLPSPQCEIFIALLGGEANRVAADATAYPHRDAKFVLTAHGRWEDPEQDGERVAWSRELFEAAKPYALGGVYVNFVTDEETDRIGAAYGPNYERLAQVKRKFDPGNLFHLNQNIKPAA